MLSLCSFSLKSVTQELKTMLSAKQSVVLRIQVRCAISQTKGLEPG